MMKMKFSEEKFTEFYIFFTSKRCTKEVLLYNKNVNYLQGEFGVNYHLKL